MQTQRALHLSIRQRGKAGGVGFNPDYAVGFVHETQKVKEDECSRKFRERKRGHPRGEQPKRVSTSIHRFFGSQ